MQGFIYVQLYNFKFKYYTPFITFNNILSTKNIVNGIEGVTTIYQACNNDFTVATWSHR